MTTRITTATGQDCEVRVSMTQKLGRMPIPLNHQESFSALKIIRKSAYL